MIKLNLNHMINIMKIKLFKIINKIHMHNKKMNYKNIKDRILYFKLKIRNMFIITIIKTMII